ncbi:tripartite tricarboxylate transporter substrate-binding protein [Azohydromonas lata]|uniref:tripartite tricarboxylate transporter substrate-binding protein n=1 Tax=Azohydromonas lata TaxID=45677 RepID=UPI001470F1B5|nr:tripartite tricarboxylate transporter substrate-binding protein [Azohydromonas lata]
MLARALAPKLAREDAAVIAENKPGAGGRLAVTQMLGSPADAKTLLMTADPILAIYPHVFRKLAYHTDTDIIPVAPVASEPIALVVGPMVPASVTTLAQFVDWCRKRPKDASYAAAAVQDTYAAVTAAARSPELTGTLDKLALDAYSMDQAAFTAPVKADLERWGAIVKATGYPAED